jgi:hypothetical protein
VGRPLHQRPSWTAAAWATPLAAWARRLCPADVDSLGINSNGHLRTAAPSVTQPRTYARPLIESVSCCTHMPASLAPSPLRYPACQPDLEGCAERADVLLSDPSSQIAPLVARARRCRATHHRAFDVRALMWPHAGTSSCWRVVDPGVTAQSPDQGADAQGSRDAVEPWAPLARVWLLVGAAPTRRYISHLSLALPRAWQALASAAHFTLPRGVPRSSTRTPPP